MLWCIALQYMHGQYTRIDEVKLQPEARGTVHCHTCTCRQCNTVVHTAVSVKQRKTIGRHLKPLLCCLPPPSENLFRCYFVVHVSLQAIPTSTLSSANMLYTRPPCRSQYCTTTRMILVPNDFSHLGGAIHRALLYAEVHTALIVVRGPNSTKYRMANSVLFSPSMRAIWQLLLAAV